MRKILNILLWAVLVTGATSLFVFANEKQKTVVCPEFQINIQHGDAHRLISEQYIRDRITDAGYRIRKQKLSDIRAAEIQQLLNDDPFIRNASLTIGVEGTVKANIEQRQPLVRVIPQTGESFYIDMEGNTMPLSTEFPARVMIASGRIPALKQHGPALQHQALANIYVTALAVKADAFTTALTEQIYIDESGEIQLVPKIGNHIIILGDTSGVKEKLGKLRIFYRQGIKNDAWKNYGLVNLRFRDQIVCTKTS